MKTMFGIPGALLRVESSCKQINSFHTAFQNYRKSIYRPTIPKPPRKGQPKKEPETHDLLKTLQEKAKIKELNERKVKRPRAPWNLSAAEVVGEEEKQKEKSETIQEEAKAKVSEEEENVPKTKIKQKEEQKSEEVEKSAQSVSNLYKNISFSWLKEYVPKYLFPNKQSDKSGKEEKIDNQPELTKEPPKTNKERKKTVKK